MSFYFLAAALPYIYEDPTNRPDFYPTKSLYHPSLYKSVQNILRQRPPEEITDLLNAAFDIFPEHGNDKKVQVSSKHGRNTNKNEQTDHQEQNQDPIMKRGIDYLSYTRIFDFENMIFKHFNRRERWDHPARLLDYALKSSATGAMATEYGQGDHDQDLLFLPLKVMSAVLSCPSNLTSQIPANIGHFRQAALATSIRRDLTWAFCSPVMENVKLLTIPLSDIDRYLACVSQFKSLNNISFLMDEFLSSGIVGDQRVIIDDAGNLGQVAMGPVDEDLEEIKQAMTTKRDQQFKTMFEFMRQHLAHFPKQLQHADCPMDSTWPITGVKSCPQEILDELKSLLPVANRVSMIDHTNLIQVANHIQETNLESVEWIELRRCGTGDAADKLMLANLKRCRALKRFCAVYPVPEAFKWAVEERLASDRYHAVVAARAAIISTGSETKSLITSFKPIPPPLPLVSLETIEVNTPTKRELDDIVFAFGKTLKDLTAYVGPPKFYLKAEAAQDANVAAGHSHTTIFLDVRIAAEPCWSQLPALTKIHLEALRSVRFVIESNFFCIPGVLPH
ncbi:hypothetical protein BGZ83_005594 [Gryganskiella cystojenkinii]|nr:hypothetical protein BGZ83_005594 [Gryganskiella cystojenkinii]